MAPLSLDLESHTPELPSEIADGRAAVGEVLQPVETQVMYSEKLQQLCAALDTEGIENLLNTAPNGSLNKAAAHGLIMPGAAGYIVTYFEKFSGIALDKEMALFMIRHGEARTVLGYLDNFSGLDQEVARALIPCFAALSTMNGSNHLRTPLIIERIDKFPGLVLDKETALLMIKHGGAEAVAKHIDKFSGFVLDKETALLMIRHGDAMMVAKYLDKFSGLDVEMAHALILQWLGKQVIEHIDKFSGFVLDRDAALLMIKHGGAEAVAKHIDKFSGFVLDRDTAHLMIKHGGAEAVAKHIDKFSGIALDKETALLMIQHGGAEAVAKHIDQFSGLDAEIAHLLINEGYLDRVIEHAAAFSGFQLDKDAALFILAGRASETFTRRINRFSNLDQEVAHASIVRGYGEQIIEHAEAFSGLVLDRDTAHLMIQHRGTEAVIKHIDQFSGIALDKETALLMIKHGGAEAVIKHIDQFSGLDQKVAHALILTHTMYASVIIERIDKFPGLVLDKKTALFMLKHIWPKVLVACIDKFSGLDQKVARLFIVAGCARAVIEHIDKFSGFVLDRDAALLMIKHDGAEAVIKHIDKFSGLVLDRRTALLMIKRGRAEAVAKHIDKFSGIALDRDTAHFMIQHGAVDIVIRYIYKFSGIALDKETILYLVEHEKHEKLFAYKASFSGFDQEVAHALIAKKHARVVIDNIHEFSGIALDKETALLMIQHGETWEVITKISKFSGIALDKETALLMSQHGGGSAVAYFIKNFSGADRELAIVLVADGNVRQVIEHIDKFSGLVLDRRTALLMIKRGRAEAVAKHIDKFSGIALDKETALLMIQHGGARDVMEAISNFSGFDTEVALALIAAGQGREVIKLFSVLALTPEDKCALFASGIVYGPLYKYDGKHLGPLHEQGYAIFGDAFDIHDFEILQELQAGSIPTAAAEIGIAQAGTAGIRQLREILGAFAARSLREDAVLFAQLEQPGLLQKRYLKLVRYETSEWGKHDQDSFRQIVTKTRERAEQDPRAPEAAPEYVRAELQVAELAGLAKEYEYSEAGTQRYSQLRESLLLAVQARKKEQPLQRLVGQLETSVGGLIAQFAAALVQLPDQLRAEAKSEEAIRAVLAAKQREIYELRALRLRQTATWQSALPKLARYPELQLVLRAIAAVFACRAHAGLADRIRALPKHLSLESIGAVMDIAQHVVYKETLASWATDKPARTAAKNLWNVSALEQEQAAIQRSRAGAGQCSITCVPSRGLLMELSGHISDACWASNYDSIAKEFPNFTFVTFVENPETANQKLVGGAFLIETVSKTGEPLLVIRGLNPIENLTWDIDPADFCQKFFEYAAGIARAQGRQLAIVIDPCAAASTNRPLVHAYLESIKPSLQKARLASKSKTTFNGYDITDNTYRLNME